MKAPNRKHQITNKRQTTMKKTTNLCGQIKVLAVVCFFAV
jgi:hypothetical protein